MVSQSVKDAVKNALYEKILSHVSEIRGIQSYLNELGFDGDEIVRSALETEEKEEVNLNRLLDNSSKNTFRPMSLVTQQPILKKIDVSKRKPIVSNTSKSQYKGVSKKHGNKWRARLGVDGRDVELGYFTDEIDAARAYDDAKIKVTKSLSGLNFPERYTK
jgi:hypothetical protein